MVGTICADDSGEGGGDDVGTAISAQPTKSKQECQTALSYLRISVAMAACTRILLDLQHLAKDELKEQIKQAKVCGNGLGSGGAVPARLYR